GITIDDLPQTDLVVQMRCDLIAIGRNDHKTGETIDFQRRVQQIPNTFQRGACSQSLDIAANPKLLFHTQSELVATRECGSVTLFVVHPTLYGFVRCFQYSLEFVAKAALHLRSDSSQRRENTHS